MLPPLKVGDNGMDASERVVAELGMYVEVIDRPEVLLIEAVGEAVQLLVIGPPIILIVSGTRGVAVRDRLEACVSSWCLSRSESKTSPRLATFSDHAWTWRVSRGRTARFCIMAATWESESRGEETRSIAQLNGLLNCGCLQLS